MENLATACWNCNRGKAGVPLTRPWTLIASVHGIAGPFDGLEVQRSERFPAYWVYSSDIDGEFQYFEDEIDEDVYFSEWEQRLKWGPPGLRLGFPTQRGVHDKWSNSFPMGWSRDRTLAGFYLPLELDLDPQCRNLSLGWFPGATAFDAWLTISTVRLEDEE